MSGDDLGGRIRRLRQERGMSLAQVAGGDFSRAFLNQVELGKSQPSTRVLRAIAARLDTRIDYLLDGSTPTLDREVALERARVSLAKGVPRRALVELEPAVDTIDWPLGADARVAAAQALKALGRDAEAEPLLEAGEQEVVAHADTYRLRRLRAVRAGRRFKPGGAAAQVRLAEQALREGRSQSALEHYRAARHLLEAAPAAAPKGSLESRN